MYVLILMCENNVLILKIMKILLIMKIIILLMY